MLAQYISFSFSITIISWIVGMIFSYGSGTPFTEDVQLANSVRFENGGLKPSTLYFDLKADKYFSLFGLNWKAMILVYNLFDIQNEVGVYSTTGRATTDLNVRNVLYTKRN